MKDLGKARKILGMEIIRHREKRELMLTQKVIYRRCSRGLE